MTKKFQVSGMTCSACSTHVDKAVRQIEGVADVNVNLLQNSMKVEYDGSKTDDAAIIKAVERAGYGAISESRDKNESSASSQIADHGAQEEKSMRIRLTASIAFLIPLLYVAMGPMIGLPIPGFLSGMENAVTFGMAQFLLTLPILYLNRSYFIRGFKSLAHGSPTMDTLIAIGSSAAVLYGIFAIIKMGQGLGTQNMELVHQYHMDMYFESAGTILTLITVGKYLEIRSKGKTGDAISRLMELAPSTAILFKDGHEVEVPLDQVQSGDILVVKTGSTVPVDGVVVEGNASVDESAITGESMPVDKHEGDAVTGATTTSSGYMKIRATRVGEDSTLSKIIQLVEDAGASKAPIARLADRVSAVFVPVVIGIAIIATVIWLIMGYPISFALSIGIAVLVISCPCALGLATPTAIMVGTGLAAENGILYKNAESLETAHQIDTVVLDKTGTVTDGRARVVDIYTESGLEGSHLLTLAASVEQRSEHPLAAAIMQRAKDDGISPKDVDDFSQVPGQGISAKLDGDSILAGNLRMMQTNNVDISGFSSAAEKVAARGQTPLYFSKNGMAIGLIAIADTIKPTSPQAIAALKDMKLEVILLTGDNQKTAEAIAAEAGISKVIANVLPQDKEQEIRGLQAQGKKVAMIGDGINDAPALTRADVGMAIGAGTDVAIESADVVLMKSDLMDAVTAIQLSKATIRKIKQNLFWAFFYNILGIPLAAGLFYPLLGWKLSPMFASAAMSLSSVFVVTNALLLRFFKPSTAGNIVSTDSYDKNSNIDKMNNKKEIEQMKLTMEIQGMTCQNCKKHVENALNSIDGVSASVNLDAGTADISAKDSISTDTLSKAVTEAGYEVLAIKKI